MNSNNSNIEKAWRTIVTNATVEDAGFTQTLKEMGPFTLFVPNNEAFTRWIDEVGQEEYERIRGDRDSLITLLNTHIIAGRSFTRSDLNTIDEVDTLGGLKSDMS